MKKFLVTVFAAALMYVPAESMAQSAAADKALASAGGSQATVAAVVESIISTQAAAAAALSNSSVVTDIVAAVEKNSDIFLTLQKIQDELKDVDKLDANRAELLGNLVGLMAKAKEAPEMNANMKEQKDGDVASKEIQALMAFITNTAANGVFAGNAWSEGSIEQANTIFSKVVASNGDVSTALKSAIAEVKGEENVASILDGMITACGNQSGTSASGSDGI